MLLDHFLLLILCVLYGMFFTIGKFSLQYAAPVFFTGIRMIIAGIILLGYYYFTHKPSNKLSKQQWFYIFVVSVFGIYLTNVTEFWGLQFISTGKSSLLCSFYPIITAIISWACFNETMTKKKILGLFIGTLGFIPILMGKDAIIDISGTISIFTYAELVLFISSIALALGWLFARQAIKFTKLNVFVLNGMSMLLGGIISMFHSYCSEPWGPIPIRDMEKFLLSLAVILVTSNMLSYNLHGYLLKKFTATYIAFVTLLVPMFSSLFGWLVLGEILNSSFWLSALCIGIGLSLYYRENLKLQE